MDNGRIIETGGQLNAINSQEEREWYRIQSGGTARESDPDRDRELSAFYSNEYRAGSNAERKKLFCAFSLF